MRDACATPRFFLLQTIEIIIKHVKENTPAVVATPMIPEEPAAAASEPMPAAASDEPMPAAASDEPMAAAASDEAMPAAASDEAMPAAARQSVLGVRHREPDAEFEKFEKRVKSLGYKLAENFVPNSTMVTYFHRFDHDLALSLIKNISEGMVSFVPLDPVMQHP